MPLSADQFTHALAVIKIIWIDIVLSGDNALVIALACRGLPPKQRKWGTLLGIAAATMLRIVFTGAVTTLMALPYCRLAGALLLLAIAANLTVERRPEASIEPRAHLWQAVGTIVLADIIMSIDNVLAIAAAARGSWALIIFGLALSIPLVIGGSALLMRAIGHNRVVILAGIALLGWVAGELGNDDVALAGLLGANLKFAEAWGGPLGALAALLLAAIQSRRSPTN